MDCMARRRATQDASATKWQPKETADEEDGRKRLTIMTELLQGKKATDRDFETMIEQLEKWIKLLLRPREIKARLEHFRGRGLKQTSSTTAPRATH